MTCSLWSKRNIGITGNGSVMNLEVRWYWETDRFSRWKHLISRKTEAKAGRQ